MAIEPQQDGLLKIGTIGQQSSVSLSPALTDPNAGHPTQDLSAGAKTAAEASGQKTEAANSVAMATASKTPAISPAPTTTRSAALTDPNAGHPTQDLGAGAKAAAEIYGQSQQKAQGAATAKASDSAAKTTTQKQVAAATPSKSATDNYFEEAIKNLGDYVKSGNDLVKGMLHDSFDALLSYNNTNIQASRMRLNQAGMTGADGTAMLELLARDSGMKTNEIMNQMRGDQLNKILDLNKYGYEGAAKLNEARINNERESLNTMLSTGQYDQAAGLWKKLFGTDLDVSAMKATDPAINQRVGELFQSAADLEAGGDFETAKLVRAMAARLNPQLYGTDDPEEAAKRAMAMDSSAQEIEVENKKNAVYNQKIDATISNWAKTGIPSDKNAFKDAVKVSLGAKAADIGTNIRRNTSSQDFNEMLTAIGEPPMADADYYATDPAEIAVLEKMYSSLMKYRANTTAFDYLTSSGFKADKVMEMAKDTNSWNALEAWVKKSLISPSFINSEGGVDMSPITIGEVESTVGHFFTDWPIATFKDNGFGAYTADNYSYNGYSAYGDTNKRNDPNDPYTPYQMNLDKMWENYVLAGSPGGLDRKTWFEVSGAGKLSPKDIKASIDAQEKAMNPTPPGNTPGEQPPKPGTKDALDEAVLTYQDILSDLPPSETAKAPKIIDWMGKITNGYVGDQTETSDIDKFISSVAPELRKRLIKKPMGPNNPGILSATTQAEKDLFGIISLITQGIPGDKAMQLVSIAIGKDRAESAKSLIWK